MAKTSRLILHTEGVSGKGIREHGDQGLVKVYTEDGEITFDAFEGMGADYKRREETQITIKDNGGIGDVLFKGTFAELAKELSHRRKYGMTLKEIRDEIAAFTGDKKGEAMRKAKIFAHHISISHVCRINSLRFGICKHEDGTEYENRDWLEIRYTFTDGDRDTFSIIE